MIRLSCASLSFDGFDDTDFVKTIAEAPKVGFEYLELNCWYPRTLTPIKTRDLSSRCKDAGLIPASLHVSEFGGETHHEISKDVCHKIRALEAAKELGCDLVCCSGSKRGTEGGLETIITVLREVVPVAKEMGIAFSLENHADNNLENIDDYRKIFDALGADGLGLCLDTGHFEAAGVAVWDVVNEFRSEINHIHLKENNRFGIKEFVRFGDGSTPNEALVENLIESGYSGYLVIELSPEIDSADNRPFSLADLKKPYDTFNRFTT